MKQYPFDIKEVKRTLFPLVKSKNRSSAKVKSVSFPLKKLAANRGQVEKNVICFFWTGKKHMKPVFSIHTQLSDTIE
jgi:hypothetical protein